MSKSDKVQIGILVFIGVYLLVRAAQNPIKRDKK